MNQQNTPRASKAKTVMLAFSSVLLSASLLVQHVQAGEYYKWTDEEGTVHFSEKPPEGHKNAKKMKTVVRAPVVEDVPDDKEKNDEDSEEARPEHLQVVSTKDPKRCEAEQKRLRALQSNQRLRQVNKDGSFSYLNQDQIDRELKRTLNAIKEAC